MKKHFILVAAILLTAVVVVNGANDKDDGFNDASFKTVLIGYDGNSVSKSSISDVIFDGIDVVVADGILSTSTPDGGNQPFENVGTYSVAPDGSLTFSFDTGVVGQLHEDGKSYITAKVSNPYSQVIATGIKIGNSGYTDASFKGVYRRVLFIFDNGASSCSIADMTLDGNGNVTMEGVASSLNGANQPVSQVGTYSVADDGSFTFSFGGGVPGQLHEDKKSYIVARVDTNNTQIIAAGIKVGEKNNFTNANLKGVFKRVLFVFVSDGVNGPGSSFATMTFDGKGNISIDDTWSTPDGANQTGSGTGTYSVNPDGSFSFYFGESTVVVGQLHENGKSYIATRVDNKNRQMITFGVKTDKKEKKEKKEK